MFNTTPVFYENYKATEKVVINQGGTASSKTYSIMQLLFLRAIESPRLVITVVGESIPNLKKGAYRDAETIYFNTEQLHQYIESWNRTDRIIMFKNGSIIEFTSYENEQSAKNGKRDIAFFNEANGINYQIYWQIAIRTRKQVFIDYNPTAEFWAHEKLIGNKNVRLIISDHRHNPFLTADQHNEIESIRNEDEELFKVYGRGKTGKIQGVILRNWVKVPEIPKGATFVAYGLDFGFTNDPTALVEVYRQNGELFINEMMYETKLTNQDICNKLRFFGVGANQDIIADSAEPKSIQEIYSEGFNIYGAEKGPDSINNGIDILKRYKLNVTANSLNLIKELSSYVWKKDKLGKTLNVPIDAFNHCFVGGTNVLTVYGYKPIEEIKEGEYVITPNGANKIIKKWNNGNKQVIKYRMQFDTFSLYLCCTPNHLIQTNNGWKAIEKIISSETIYLNSFTEGLSLNYIQEKNIFQEEIKECMSLYGKPKTTERFQKVIMFTTKTTTPLIIDQKIYNWKRLTNICQSMAKRGLRIIQNLPNLFMRKELPVHQNGIEAKKVKSGIKMHGIIPLERCLLKKNITANNVASAINQEQLISNQNIAILTAKLVHCEPEESWEEPVYDLMVENEHCYFANGILVHNCIDPLRYIALSKLSVAERFELWTG